MWLGNLCKLLAHAKIRQIQVTNPPLQDTDMILLRVPEELIPILQLAALYRVMAERIDDSSRVWLRKDHELIMRARSSTFRAMIDALCEIFHCCLLEHCVTIGMSGSGFQRLLARGYEIRAGWWIVVPKQQ